MSADPVMMTAGVGGAGLAVSVFLAVVSTFWARTREDRTREKQERYMVFSMTVVLVKKMQGKGDGTDQ